MRAPEAREFQRATTKEVNTHIEKNNWERNQKEKCKNNNNFSHPYGHSKKYGHQYQKSVQTQGTPQFPQKKQGYASNYFEKFSPGATWFIIRMVLVH